MSQVATAIPSPSLGVAYSVEVLGGSVRLSPRFEIKYEVKNGGKCFLWRSDEPERFALTLFNSPSGSGKTTFLSEVYRRIRNRASYPSQLKYDFHPDFDTSSTIGVAYVPQNPPMVNHWRLTEILPEQPSFLECFFPGEKFEELSKKTLGEFSGGQRRKLYTCSVLERVAIEESVGAFVLLDETFDGLGAIEAKRCLTAIEQKWKELTQKSLHILVVTHLDDTDLVEQNSKVVKLGLVVKSSRETQLVVELFNKS